MNEIVMSTGDSLVTQCLTDLTRASNLSYAGQLEELFRVSLVNLENKMAAGQILAEDPTFVLESFKTMYQAQLSLLEAKRKVAETMIKARALYTPPHRVVDDGGPLDQDPPVDVSTGAAFEPGVPGEQGFFGGVVEG